MSAVDHSFIIFYYLYFGWYLLWQSPLSPSNSIYVSKMVLLFSSTSFPSAVSFCFIPLSLSLEILNILLIVFLSCSCFINFLKKKMPGEMFVCNFLVYTLVWSAG